MKRFSILALAAGMLLSLPMQAQNEDKNLFNHLSVGLTVGSTGWGLDVAAPIGDYVQTRVGFTLLPNFKYKTNVHVSGLVPAEVINQYGQTYNIPTDKVKVEGKTNVGDFKFLIDVYPFKRSSFHLTTGFYIGSSKVVKAYNKEDGVLLGVNQANKDIALYNAELAAGVLPAGAPGPFDPIGLKMGDYIFTPNSQGNVNAYIKTAGFKPYLGLGFGRAVPKKRVSVMFDAGVQFWGTPKVYLSNDDGDRRLEKKHVEGNDGGFFKTMSKITVYPVLSLRICGRIF